MKKKYNTPKKSAKPIQQGLRATWSFWILFRLLMMPLAISYLAQSRPDLAGGIFWYGLWLIPAFILTPWILSGKSPYALLMGTMLMLVYLGASGFVLFSRFYDSTVSLICIYSFDVLLLLLINIFIFILLKRLPKMNA